MTRKRYQLLTHPEGRRILPSLFGWAIFVALLGLARAYGSFPGDEWVLQEVGQARAGWLDDAAMVLSAVGQGGIAPGIGVPWIPAVVVAATLAARRWADAALLAAAAFAPVLNLGLKELAARPRPDAGMALIVEAGYAFPSGHAVFAAAFFGALLWLADRWTFLDSRLELRTAFQGALLLLILAVGFSRVYIGVHWPSDVVAGFLFGVLFLRLVAGIQQKLGARQHATAHKQKEGGY